MELSSSNNKKFQGTETPKKIPYISETETLKNLLLFREMEPFTPPREIFSYFRKQKPGKNF